MPLSEYESRVLREIERQLSTSRFARMRAKVRAAVLLPARVALSAYWPALLAVVLAVVIIGVLTAFAPGAAAAPLAALAAAPAGYVLCRCWYGRRLHTRR